MGMGPVTNPVDLAVTRKEGFVIMTKSQLKRFVRTVELITEVVTILVEGITTRVVATLEEISTWTTIQIVTKTPIKVTRKVAKVAEKEIPENAVVVTGRGVDILALEMGLIQVPQPTVAKHSFVTGVLATRPAPGVGVTELQLKKERDQDVRRVLGEIKAKKEAALARVNEAKRQINEAYGFDVNNVKATVNDKGNLVVRKAGKFLSIKEWDAKLVAALQELACMSAVEKTMTKEVNMVGEDNATGEKSVSNWEDMDSQKELVNNELAGGYSLSGRDGSLDKKGRYEVIINDDVTWTDKNGKVVSLAETHVFESRNEAADFREAYAPGASIFKRVLDEVKDTDEESSSTNGRFGTSISKWIEYCLEEGMSLSEARASVRKAMEDGEIRHGRVHVTDTITDNGGFGGRKTYDPLSNKAKWIYSALVNWLTNQDIEWNPEVDNFSDTMFKKLPGFKNLVRYAREGQLDGALETEYHVPGAEMVWSCRTVSPIEVGVNGVVYDRVTGEVAKKLPSKYLVYAKGGVQRTTVVDTLVLKKGKTLNTEENIQLQVGGYTNEETGRWTPVYEEVSISEIVEMAEKLFRDAEGMANQASDSDRFRSAKQGSAWQWDPDAEDGMGGYVEVEDEGNESKNAPSGDEAADLEFDSFCKDDFRIAFKEALESPDQGLWEMVTTDEGRTSWRLVGGYSKEFSNFLASGKDVKKDTIVRARAVAKAMVRRARAAWAHNEDARRLYTQAKDIRDAFLKGETPAAVTITAGGVQYPVFTNSWDKDIKKMYFVQMKGKLYQLIWKGEKITSRPAPWYDGKLLPLTQVKVNSSEFNQTQLKAILLDGLRKETSEEMAVGLLGLWAKTGQPVALKSKEIKGRKGMVPMDNQYLPKEEVEKLTKIWEKINSQLLVDTEAPQPEIKVVPKTILRKGQGVKKGVAS